MPRGKKKQTVQEQPKKRIWSRKKKSSETSSTAPSESTSSTDLGSLHKELLQIQQQTQQIREQEKELVRRKSEVEQQLRGALKGLGIFNMVSGGSEDGAEAPRRGRKPGGSAKASKADGGGAGKAKTGGGGPRYTDEERRAAVEFVDNEVKGGATITDAIAQFNKSGKPRGKAPMNYQSLLRWRAQ